MLGLLTLERWAMILPAATPDSDDLNGKPGTMSNSKIVSLNWIEAFALRYVIMRISHSGSTQSHNNHLSACCALLTGVGMDDCLTCFRNSSVTALALAISEV